MCVNLEQEEGIHLCKHPFRRYFWTVKGEVLSGSVSLAKTSLGKPEGDVLDCGAGSNYGRGLG